MDGALGHIAHLADLGGAGAGKDAVGQHIDVELPQVQAAGHDLHGLLGPEHLRPVLQQGLPCRHNKIHDPAALLAVGIKAEWAAPYAPPIVLRGAHSSPRVVCLYFTTKAAASQGQELAKKICSACRKTTRSRGNPFLPAVAGQKFLPPGIPLGTKFGAEPRTSPQSGSHTLSAKFPCMCPVHPHMSAGQDFFDSLGKKDLLLPVDKTARRGYNKNDIIKLALYVYLFLRIDLYQRAWTVRAGGEQGAENGLGAARARGKSAKPATGAPVTASGCRAMGPPCRRSIEAVPRKGAVNQGGTTEAFCSRPCRFFRPVGTGVFLFRPGPSSNLTL